MARAREEKQSRGYKIGLVHFDSGVDNPPRSGQKQNRLDESIAAQIMEDLSEVVDDLMDRTPEFPTLLKRTKSRKKPKYRQTGNLLAASMLQALTVETGLKLLYEINNPQKLAPQTHDLLKIFEILSEGTQNRLNSMYIQLVNASSYVKAMGADLSVPELSHIKEVFRVHAKMFVLWRYLAEGRAGPGFSEHLCRAVDAIRILIEESMDSSSDETRFTNE